MQEEIEVITEEDMDKNDPTNPANREFYVYKHIRLDNNTCFYVGKGKGNRIYVPKRNRHHDNIRKRYGCEVVKVKENLTEKEAFELEREIIEDYVFVFGYGINIKGYDDYDHELPHLTNYTWGGEGVSGRKHSEEEKQKMSESHKGHITWNKGIKLSEEHKQNLSESLKGRQLSEEHKQNLSESMKGKHCSGETKKKISESNKGKNKGKIPWNKGKQFSEETKLKMSKKVICITTGETFNSLKEASDHYNVSKGNMSSCCRGKRKYAGELPNGTRLQWEYLKNYDN